LPDMPPAAPGRLNRRTGAWVAVHGSGNATT